MRCSTRAAIDMEQRTSLEENECHSELPCELGGARCWFKKQRKEASKTSKIYKIYKAVSIVIANNGCNRLFQMVFGGLWSFLQLSDPFRLQLPFFLFPFAVQWQVSFLRS